MLRGLKDAADLVMVSKTDNKVKLKTKYARTSALDFTAESVYARNKNVKAIRWDGNREGTFKTSFEIFDMKLIGLLFGKDIESGTIPFMKSEVLKVVNGTATMEGTSKVGTLQVYKTETNDRNAVGVEQTVGTVATTENKYTISGKTFTFNATTFPNDSYAIVFYMVENPCKTFTVDSVSFPGGYEIFGDTLLRDTDQVDKPAQFHLPNVKPQSNVSFSMDSDNVTTLEITWDILADAQGDMMTWSWIEE